MIYFFDIVCFKNKKKRTHSNLYVTEVTNRVNNSRSNNNNNRQTEKNLFRYLHKHTGT